MTAFTQAMSQMKKSIADAGKDAAKLQDEYDKIETQIEANANKRLRVETTTNQKIAAEQDKAVRRAQAIQSAIDATRQRQTNLTARTGTSYYQKQFDDYRDPKIAERKDVVSRLATANLDVQNTTLINKLNRQIKEGLNALQTKYEEPLRKTLKSVQDAQDALELKHNDSADRIAQQIADLETSKTSSTRIKTLKKQLDAGIESLVDSYNKPLEKTLAAIKASKAEISATREDNASKIRASASAIEREQQAYEDKLLARRKAMNRLLAPEAHRGSYDKSVANLEKRLAAYSTIKADPLSSESQKGDADVHSAMARARLNNLTMDGGDPALGFAKYAEEHIDRIRQRIKVYDERIGLETKEALEAFKKRLDDTNALPDITKRDQRKLSTLDTNEKEISSLIAQSRAKADKQIADWTKELEAERVEIQKKIERLKVKPTLSSPDRKRYENLLGKEREIDGKIADATNKANREFAAIQAELASESAKPSPQIIGGLRSRLTQLDKSLAKTITQFAATKIDTATQQLTTLNTANAERGLNKASVATAFTKLETTLRLQMAEMQKKIDDEELRLRNSQVNLRQSLPHYSIESATIKRDAMAGNVDKLNSGISAELARRAKDIDEVRALFDKQRAKDLAAGQRLDKSLTLAEQKRSDKGDTLYEAANLKDYRGEYASYYDKRNEKIGLKADELLTESDPDKIRRINASLAKMRKATLSEEEFIARHIENAMQALSKHNLDTSKVDDINRRIAHFTGQINDNDEKLTGYLVANQSALSRYEDRMAKKVKANAKALRDAEAKLEFAEKIGGQDPRMHFQQKAQENFQSAGIATAGAAAVFMAAKAGADDRRDLLNALANTSVGEDALAAKNFGLFNAQRQEYMDTINNMSIRTGRGVKELADSLRESENVLGSLGKEKVMEGWRASIKGAIATGGDLMTMTKAATGLVNLFGDEFATGAQAVNVLSMAARKSPLELNTLAESIGNLSNVGKIVGATGVETIAMFQTLTQQQIKSTDAATQLRNMMLRITSPVTQVRKELAKLDLATGKKGMDSLAFAFSHAGVKALGVTGVLQRVVDMQKQLGLSSGEVAQKIWPNLRGEIGASVTIEQFEKLIENAQKLTAAKEDDAFITATYNTNLASTASQMDMAANKTRVLSQELGQALLPTLHSLNRVIEIAVSLSQKMDAATQANIVTFGLASAGTFALYKGLSGITGLIGFLASGLAGLTGKFAGLASGAGSVAAFIGTKLNPWIAGGSILLGLGALAWNKWGGSAGDSAKKAREELEKTNKTQGESITADYRKNASLAGLVTKYRELLNTNHDNAKAQAELASVRAQLLETSGINIEAIDNEATQREKLNKILKIELERKLALAALAYTNFTKTSPDRIKSDDAQNAYGDALSKKEKLKTEIARLKDERSKTKSDYIGAELGGFLKKVQDELGAVEKSLPLLKKKADANRLGWEHIRDNAQQGSKKGQLPGLTGLGQAGIDAAAAAEEARLQRIKDTEANALSQARSEASSFMGMYESNLKNIFVKNQQKYAVGNESLRVKGLRTHESEAEFKAQFGLDWLNQRFKKLLDNKTDKLATIEAFNAFLKDIKSALVGTGKSLDDLAVEEDRIKTAGEKAAKALAVRNGIVDTVQNMISDAKANFSDTKDSVTRSINKYMGKQTKDGTNISLIQDNDESRVAIRSLYIAAELLDERNEITSDIIAKWKLWGKNSDDIRSARIFAYKQTHTKTDTQEILYEMFGDKYESLASIADESVRNLVSAQVEVVKADRVAKELARKSKESKESLEAAFKSEGDKIAGVAEQLQKAKGQLRLIGADDYSAFLDTKGVSPEEIAKHDSFGVYASMYRELFDVEQRTEKAKEVLSRLKDRKLNQTGNRKIGTTGNEVIDRINADLDKETRFENNLRKVQIGFERAVSKGLTKGFKGGMLEMLDELKSQAIGEISKVIAKGLFDSINRTGIFDKLFKYTGLGKETKDALSNPEAFAQSLARQTLNVNVVNPAFNESLRRGSEPGLDSRADGKTVGLGDIAKLIKTQAETQESPAWTETFGKYDTSERKDKDYKLTPSADLKAAVDRMSSITSSPAWSETFGKDETSPNPNASGKAAGTKEYATSKFSRKINPLEAAGYIAAAKDGSFAGKVHAGAGLAKMMGAKAAFSMLSKLSPYLAANELLGNPAGKAFNWWLKNTPPGKNLAWIGRQAFGWGKKKNMGSGTNGWGNPNAKRSESVVSGGQTINVNMPNATMVSPTDAPYVASEVGRVLRSSPAMVGV